MSKLHEARVSASLSQSQLAAKSGVGVRMIQHYEQGQKPIDKAQVRTVLRLASALGCSLGDILESEELVALARDPVDR